MGADMCVAALAVRKDKGPNWEAGQKWLESLADNKRLLAETIAYIEEDGSIELSYCETSDGGSLLRDDDETKLDHKRVLKWLCELLDGFRASLHSRYVTTISVRDLWIYISGGLSYGDAPTEECRMMWEITTVANSTGSLLEAMGFVTDYDQPEALVTPEEEQAAVESIRSVTA